MIYHVQLNDKVSVKQSAENPEEAALGAIQTPDVELSKIVMVSKRPIKEKMNGDEMIFWTPNLQDQLCADSPLPNGGLVVV
jgi:hypothetical protein